MPLPLSVTLISMPPVSGGELNFRVVTETSDWYCSPFRAALKGEQYQSLVSVTTRKFNSPPETGGIEIRVTDNGNGIPQNIVDKIFQPFFTTKPPGQGTGLGLSLAYDIIKANGGDIKVKTKELEGAEFIIQL